jgi:hypothetical protein
MIGVIEKDVLVALAKTASEWARSMNEQISLAKYDLVANICHDSSGAQELTVKAGERYVTNILAAIYVMIVYYTSRSFISFNHTLLARPLCLQRTHGSRFYIPTPCCKCKFLIFLSVHKYSIIMS